MINFGYILAASHSGSTLLTMLLNSHPQVSTVGELKLSSLGDINHYRCSCGDFIKDCKFWREVEGGMIARGFEFDLNNTGMDYRFVDSRYARWLLGYLHRGRLMEYLRDGALAFSPTWQKQLLKIHKKNVALISILSQISNTKVVIDSSKNALRLKYLLKNTDLEVKIIRLIRDGRAIALTSIDTDSYADAKDPSLRGGGSGSRQKSKRPSMAQAAYTWWRSNQEAENVLSRLDKSKWIEVRYEQLCMDTENTLKRIYKFLYLDPHKRAKDFRSVEHHVVGNGMRLDTTSEIQLDVRWHSVLTKEDLLKFDRIAGKMNRKYGYE